jgi:predicted transposase YbfD/YdcC
MQMFRAVFAELPDPRDSNAHHDLTELLFIALAASLCGAQTCAAMAEFGCAKKDLLRQFLVLKHGVPSHDTFSRVFRLLDPQAFATTFARFMAAFGEAARIEAPAGVVAVDGKSLRRGYAAGRAHMPPLLVSAWGARTRMVLAQQAAPGGNEVEATLVLLSLLSLQGCIVTADALHCHRRMAEAVRAADADYALIVKGSQPALLHDARASLDAASADAPVAETRDAARGRVERRLATVAPAPDMAERHRFPGLVAVGRVEAWREAGGATRHRVRHVLLSRRLTPAELLAVTREHWTIENRLHWVLDVVLDEDLARARKDHAPQNLALLRRLALNVLRAHPGKQSLNLKRQRAGWDESFLLELFTHMR